MTNEVLLAELIAPASKGAPLPGLPVYSVTKHRGFVPSLEYFNKRVFSKDLSKYKVLRPGTFAYATIHLDEGSIGIAPEDCLISPMYTAFEVDLARVDPGYLIRLLKSPEIVSRYATLGRGTAERRRSISLDALGSLRVKLPSLPSQRRIASILDQCESVRSARVRATTEIDQSISEIFLALVDGAFESRALGDLGRVVTGRTPPKSQKGSFGDQIPFVTPGDLERTVEASRFLSEDGAKLVPTVRPGSLLVCCIGATVGKVAMAKTTVAFNQQINAVEWGDSIAPGYGLYAAKAQKATIVGAASSTTMPILNKTAFSRIQIPVPPMEVQHAFERSLEIYDVARSKQISHLAMIDELFASLQYRAFRGEL